MAAAGVDSPGVTAPGGRSRRYGLAGRRHGATVVSAARSARQPWLWLVAVAVVVALAGGLGIALPIRGTPATRHCHRRPQMRVELRVLNDGVQGSSVAPTTIDINEPICPPWQFHQVVCERYRYRGGRQAAPAVRHHLLNFPRRPVAQQEPFDASGGPPRTVAGANDPKLYAAYSALFGSD